MPDPTYQALEAFKGFEKEVVRIAQDLAGAEAVLYAKNLSDDSRSLARFEYELLYEVECWKAIESAITRRRRDREALLEKQLAKRAAERVAPEEG